MKRTKDTFIHETKVAVTSFYHCRVWLMSNTLHHDCVCLVFYQVIFYYSIAEYTPTNYVSSVRTYPMDPVNPNNNLQHASFLLFL